MCRQGQGQSVDRVNWDRERLKAAPPVGPGPVEVVSPGVVAEAGAGSPVRLLGLVVVQHEHLQPDRQPMMRRFHASILSETFSY